MKKLITVILAMAIIVTIVATPTFKVNSPTFTTGITIKNDRNNSNGISTH